MPEYSPQQKRIIQRYYDHHETIMLTKLQELVGDLFLADSEKKRNQLWKSARTAMEKLKIGPSLIEHILSQRDPKVLASNLQDWLNGPKAGG